MQPERITELLKEHSDELMAIIASSRDIMSVTDFSLMKFLVEAKSGIQLILRRENYN